MEHPLEISICENKESPLVTPNTWLGGALVVFLGSLFFNLPTHYAVSFISTRVRQFSA